MALLIQKSGFGRFEIAEFARVFRVDARAAWCGTQINDKLAVGLREAAERLEKVSFNGARNAIVVVDGRSLFVWKARIAKDGDTYERQSERNEVTRGSLALLRAAYGKGAVTVTDESGAKRLVATKKADRGTLAFYSLSHLVAKAEKKEKTDKGAKTAQTVKDALKSASKGKDKGKGKK